jgi:5,10-methylenetetrahydromethanopterin reductase
MGISPQESTRRVGDLAAAAERMGIDALWLIDSQLVMRDAYLGLSTAALRTSHLKLGPGVTNPYTRHPTVTANTIATLDELSGGRALLGSGAGDSSLFPLGMKPASIKDMRAWLHQIRGLLAGDAVELGDSKITLKTGRSVPIFLAASQPRMLRLAGELADGVILMGIASPELIQQQLTHLREGMSSAGRPEGSVFVDYWATISIRQDIGEATREVRSWASAQARWVSRWDSLPPSLERFRVEADEAARSYDFGSHLSVNANHATVVSDEFARLAAVVGDQTECLRRLRAIAALGLDRITLTLLSRGRDQRLREFEDLLGVWQKDPQLSPEGDAVHV